MKGLVVIRNFLKSRFEVKGVVGCCIYFFFYFGGRGKGKDIYREEFFKEW